MDTKESEYTKARFWKCALQVNPYDYISYRGSVPEMTEEEYNRELLRYAEESKIKVIGIADHGNVNEVDAIRNLMGEKNIIVFPGFEITSSEKVHFVCLFPEDTTKDDLNLYMGNLGIKKSSGGTWPSTLTGNDLLKEVDALGGFAYAAHCTGDSGILKEKMYHVWTNPLLKATQIPSALDDLKNDECNKYYLILKNKTPEYKRENPIAIINAKAVAKPEDLADEKASCLIKMTRPCFQSFKRAFQDPESRIRLHSDVSKEHYSCFESLKITGGYLGGALIDFSKHLNAVIGGRGTGKSTLLESIRYALDMRPIGKNAQKQHDDIIKENLGKEGGTIELVVRSSTMNGKLFTITRRYGESVSVRDEGGKLSSFAPSDILPGIEIYGQNEIYEIAQDKDLQLRLLSRFLESDKKDGERKIQKALDDLIKNREKLLEAEGKVSELEDEVVNLDKLEEKREQCRSLGLEEKLKTIQLLAKEKELLKRVVEEEGQNLDQAFQAVKDSLPDTVFLSESALSNLPHVESLRKLRLELDGLRGKAEVLLGSWQSEYDKAKENIKKLVDECNSGRQKEEAAFTESFYDLPSFKGKSGPEMGVELHDLIKDIERIRPKKTLIENRRKVIEELRSQRTSILDELYAFRVERSTQFNKSLKKLNKRLKGKLQLEVKSESDYSSVISFLSDCGLENVRRKRLSWIEEAQKFSPIKLAELIMQGRESLEKSDWNITDTVIGALLKMTKEQVLKLEENELPDVISIKLNTAHEGPENFKPMDKLSAGQKCTAILHLLLLQNHDPLIMDQPEDNLDNAFIADRIVTELRSAKLLRQFVFATHNANIPVFGDAEWIGVFEASENRASIPKNAQGAIDVDEIKEKAANILEGGKAAFNQRKAKYGF